MKCILHCKYQHTLTSSLPRDYQGTDVPLSSHTTVLLICNVNHQHTDNYAAQRLSGYRCSIVLMFIFSVEEEEEGQASSACEPAVSDGGGAVGEPHLQEVQCLHGVHLGGI